MTIRADSYGSVAEVAAYTRHLLDGETTYTGTTRPSLTEVEKFIDRASGYLNVALRTTGLHTPIANSTAKLACDDWVVSKAAEYVELTQRGTGYSEAEGSRIPSFRSMHKDAISFANEFTLCFKELGVTVDRSLASGLAFTGLDAQHERNDPDDSDMVQPMFSRHRFDQDDPLVTGEED